MDIFDLAKATGLSREQICFYEDRKILAERLGTKHKDYFDHDVNRLKKTVLLRKLGFGLSEVRNILDDAVSLESALTAQLVPLEAEKKKFTGAYNLCVAMLEEIRISGEGKSEHLDAARWSEFIRREEAAGHTFVDCWQDIDPSIHCYVFEPLFVKTLRKDKWRVILQNLLGIAMACGVGLLVHLILPGYWTVNYELPLCLAIYILCSLPRYLLGKKHPWAAVNLPWILCLFGALIVLVLLLLL